MISYAQNGEDVVLARLFDRQPVGHYVDVGAWDPVIDSVTKHFYDRGWRGVNVEPHPQCAAQLRAARPEDVTLELALSRRPGSATLHLDGGGRSGLSTLDGRTAKRVLDEPRADLRVRTSTLAAVVAEHVAWPIDFLKIDVEGHERAVLAGADWSRFAPRVVVVEATEPNTAVPSHRRFEPLLLEAGYRCVLFDGLNRFYAREQDATARQALATPANPIDDYVRYDLVNQAEEARRLAEERAELAERCTRLEQRVSSLERSLARERASEAARAVTATRAPGARGGASNLGEPRGTSPSRGRAARGART